MRDRLLVGAACAGLAVASGCAGITGTPRNGSDQPSPEPLPISTEAFMDTASGIFVLVDLDENVLSLMHGDRAIWRAPVGTGTGLHLMGDDTDWLFTTPRGVFQVQYKEELPVWYLPDWYFVENELPIPPEGDPSRKMEGQLGVAAVYIAPDVAIHGTNRPELLGQRVSHGCIRLENRFAQRLFHNVQIGTPVVIVGGEYLASAPPPPPADEEPPPPPPDPLAGVSTTEILRRLGDRLEAGDTTGAWVPLASRLITRGLKDDATALRGLLSYAGTAGTDALNLEYSTFLADAYYRGSWRAVVSLARIDADARERATRAIVTATMALYAGSPFDPQAPWPTKRLHEGVLGPEGQAGWESLLAAEAEYRQASTGRMVGAQGEG